MHLVMHLLIVMHLVIHLLIVMHLVLWVSLIPLELVCFWSCRYSVSSCLFLCPTLPLSFLFSYSNVEVENSWGVFRPISSVFIPCHHALPYFTVWWFLGDTCNEVVFYLYGWMMIRCHISWYILVLLLRCSLLD